MPKLTLAEKLQKAAQRKARAEQTQARIKLIQRKQRVRSLISIGALAERAGIADLSEPALYACFLRIAEEARDPRNIETWEVLALPHFEPEQTDHTIAVARFPEKLDADDCATLRQLGFRRNRLLDQWEGRVPYGEAVGVVARFGGAITRIGPGSASNQMDPGAPEHPSNRGSEALADAAGLASARITRPGGPVIGS